MSLRELAPHGTLGDSSTSSSAKAHPSAGSSSTAQTSGDQGESGGGGGGAGGGGRPPGKGDDGSSRRRRGAGSVSQKACDACRHARQKVSVVTLQVASYPSVFVPPFLFLLRGSTGG